MGKIIGKSSISSHIENTRGNILSFTSSDAQHTAAVAGVAVLYEWSYQSPRTVSYPMKRKTIQLQELFYETATAIEFSENAIITIRSTKSMQPAPPTRSTRKWTACPTKHNRPQNENSKLHVCNFFQSTVKWQTCLGKIYLHHKFPIQPQKWRSSTGEIERSRKFIPSN